MPTIVFTKGNDVALEALEANATFMVLDGDCSISTAVFSDTNLGFRYRARDKFEIPSGLAVNLTTTTVCTVHYEALVTPPEEEEPPPEEGEEPPPDGEEDPPPEA